MAVFRVSIVSILLLLSGALRVQALPEHTYDVFVGNGSAGPFHLAWKNVQPRSETVQVDSTTLMPILDYTLDAADGTLTLCQPAPPSAAILVNYDYDTETATRSSNGPNIPLLVNLIQGNQGNLSFDAVVQNPNGGNDDPQVRLGLGSAVKAGHADLKIRWLYADDGQGSALEQTGLSISGTDSVSRKVKLSFGLASAGVGLGSAGSEAGMTAGAETLSLGAHVDASHLVSADVGFSNTNAHGAAPDTTTSLGLTVTPSNTLKIQSNLNVSGTAAALNTQTGIDINDKPTSKSQVDVAFKEATVPGQDATRAVNVTTSVAPSKTVTVNADAGRNEAQGDGANTGDVGVILAPAKTVRLNTDVAVKQDDSGVSTTVATAGGSVNPLSFVKIAGLYQKRYASANDTDQVDTLDSSSATVTLAPFKKFNLTGSYVENPVSGQTPKPGAERGLGLTTTLGIMTLDGGYDWTRDDDTQDIGTKLHLDIGLCLSANTRLTGNYQQAMTGSVSDPTDPSDMLTVGTQQFSLGLQHSLGELFQMSLDATVKRSLDPTGNSPGADVTGAASLGVRF